MAKTLCKWKREDFGKKGKSVKKATQDATHYCQKCARVANKKGLLCRADPFKKNKQKGKGINPSQDNS